MLTGVLDGHTRLATLSVDAGGIPPYRRVVGNGGLEGPSGSSGAGGIVVEVTHVALGNHCPCGSHRPDLEAIPRASIAYSGTSPASASPGSPRSAR